MEKIEDFEVRDAFEPVPQSTRAAMGKAATAPDPSDVWFGTLWFRGQLLSDIASGETYGQSGYSRVLAQYRTKSGFLLILDCGIHCDVSTLLGLSWVAAVPSVTVLYLSDKFETKYLCSLATHVRQLRLAVPSREAQEHFNPLDDRRVIDESTLDIRIHGRGWYSHPWARLVSYFD